jgi:glutamate carboxypeptidase
VIMHALPISYFESRLPEFLRLLRTLVQIESPTTDKGAVDRLGTFAAERMRALNAEVTVHTQEEVGDHWVGQWGSPPGGILLLTHMDTVYPLGTLEGMPWRLEDLRAWGPGVLDMKAGLALALVVLGVLQREGRMPSHRITLLCTSDEETGSETSRPLIEQLSRGHELVLCLEPGLPDGSLKTWRKGVGMFQVEAGGRAAHAGADPGAGVSAILEMAHQIPALDALADEAAGTTVNVGVIHGGTRSNVVAARCSAEVDVRVMDNAEQVRIVEALGGLEAKLEGASVQVSGGWNRPPMPRTPERVRAFDQAREIATTLGMTLSEGGTGGGSDANFVAPLGVPVLDGLGAIGSGAHSRREHIRLDSLASRAALLAGLLTGWFRSGSERAPGR